MDTDIFCTLKNTCPACVRLFVFLYRESSLFRHLGRWNWILEWTLAGGKSKPSKRTGNPNPDP